MICKSKVSVLDLLHVCSGGPGKNLNNHALTFSSVMKKHCSKLLSIPLAPNFNPYFISFIFTSKKGAWYVPLLFLSFIFIE